MLEILMQNYGVTYNRAVELYKMPMLELIATLDMLNVKKMASKTEAEASVE